ncbi:phospholipid-transporting ATPase ABCA3-like [Ornithodoros turicata]|uniref:phospholipid-transporting ATPase ABCA3-like n=1 Tax=Ornithodoros turicata TaxID=34597 RepID=UPI0031390C02
MMCIRHFLLLLWKDIYVVQIRRHALLNIAEFTFPALLTYTYIYISVTLHESAPTDPTRRVHHDRGFFHAIAEALFNTALVVNEMISHDHPRIDNISLPAPAVFAGSVWKESASENARALDKTFVRYLFQMLPILVSMNFVQPWLVKKISTELSLGLKELMITNGLSEFIYWFSNFVGMFLLLCITALPVVLIGKIRVLGHDALLEKSNLAVIMLGVVLHCFASTLLCFVVASVVPRPSVGVVSVTFVLLGTLIAPMVMATAVPTGVEQNSTEHILITLSCLFPNIGFSYFLVNVALLEARGTGAQLWNLNQVGLHSMTIYRLLNAMGGSCFISTVLTWYLGNIWPLSYAFPEKFWFFLDPIYWGFWPNVGISGEHAGDIKENPAIVEPVPESMDPFLVMYRLSKVIDPPYLKHYILHSATLKAYLDNITVILGRNGCGKSILVRILTGAIKPSGGTAFLNQMDIRLEASKIRNVLGYCPQRSSLFQHLTVEENVWFISEIRGLESVHEEVETALMQFQMSDVKGKLVKNTTYGEQRRLQVAIALLGRPQYAILDSPTTGTDTESRNIVWDSILKARAQTGMLFATNSIDEADVVGDRVAILSKGGIRCCGSSIFLRRQYGLGYRLHLTTSMDCEQDQVSKFIRKILPSAYVYTRRKRNILYGIGFANPRAIIYLLEKLEEVKKKMRIKRIGVCASSLEDVLLRLEEETDPEDFAQDDDEGDSKSSMMLSSVHEPRKKAHFVWRHQLHAIYLKKTAYMRRSYVIIPVLLVVQVILMGVEEVSLSSPNNWEDVDAVIASMKHSTVFESSDRHATTSALANVSTEIHKVIFAQRTMGTILVPISLSLIVAAFVDLPLVEHTSGAKQIQLMAGLSAERFWVISFLQDLTFHLVITVFCTLPMVVFELQVRKCGNYFRIGASFIMFMMFGWSFLPLVYLFSLYFESSVIAYFALVSFGSLFGALLNLSLSLLSPRAVSSFWPREVTTGYVEVISLPMRLIPQFTLVQGTGSIKTQLLENEACCHISGSFLKFVCDYQVDTASMAAFFASRLQKCCAGVCSQKCKVNQQTLSLDSKSCIWDFTMLFLSGLLYLMIVISRDMKVKQKFTATDVEEFMKSVQESEEPSEDGKKRIVMEESLLAERKKVSQLVKRFFDPNETTVQRGLIAFELLQERAGFPDFGPITFYVPPGEIFGILGLAQAGRTLLLQMIAGREPLKKGNAFMNGIDVKRRPINYQQQLGYCPQYDPLIDKLTGEEMLLVIAELRGIEGEDLANEVQYIQGKVGLNQTLHMQIGKYSASNRRKLSIGIALIGEPPLVLLDECAQGVDPATRGRLFQSMDKIHSDCGMAVLFTSHCMRECDMFCDRLAILSSGVFSQIGSTIALKTSAGQRCTVIVKLSVQQSVMKDYYKTLIRGMGEKFDNCVIAEVREDQVWFRLKGTTLVWSEIFECMEELKDELHFLDYLVNEASLGEVFLGFARERKMVDFGKNKVRYFDKEKPPTESEGEEII